ncbi:sulfotransferase family 2 domain-containing protein [Paracoccus sp. R12_1]|uniref:sulfotransferase family 2 domain-containing protein n=1 Tax=unclassified Paracoccus (in: a-proteobacteria) TaxID=2688777 RepID=UPI001ADBD3C9|nr:MULTISPECIES: sulfotransferase family 2 domain-containing protein [unclassified Paracoccus (in: a-proteobacteria)]MBO9455575.1 sulfotransferase family 2 domain-containing protein [Paracoccus sp. R12_2]MBO9486245.1 sulfotransferase family 2 domain-containing protein [Paracoccus sp. R12_1]
MLIFWEERLVFLATPKAGSTAVETALESLSSAAIQRPAVLKHTNISSYRSHLAPWLDAQTGDRFTTVALMREPVDWLRSWYRFKLRDDLEDPLHRMEGVSFSRFVRDYISPGGRASLMIGTQSEFLTDDHGHVDRIFRYEDMAGFVEFLEDRLNCAIELPRINVPPSVDVRLDQDEETLLRECLRDDISLYAKIGKDNGTDEAAAGDV